MLGVQLSGRNGLLGRYDLLGSYGRVMTEPADEDRVARRAELLPEEQAAGTDDPQAQAEAILAESDERTEQPEHTRQESVQTPE